MTLTNPYTAEIHAGTSGAKIIGRFRRRAGGMEGFGNPPVEDYDGPRGNLDGEVGGVDHNGPRVLRFSTELDDADGSLSTQLRSLKAAWRSMTDTTLDVRDPLFDVTGDVLRYYGRPRTCDADVNISDYGLIPVLLSFKCLDPFGYGPSEQVIDSSSPAAVTSDGDVPTDRFTITIDGDGGTPVLTSTTDDSSVVAFQVPLGASSTAVLDFRTREVTVDGNDAYDQLAPAPRWFRLLPGANSITFTGCTSLQIDHRPAYL